MSARGKNFIKKGVTYDAGTKAVVDCIFCRIHKREEPGRIVFEDEEFVVFHTIKPVTHLHLLVTTREHIKNIGSLHGAKGAALVTKLVDVGKKALGSEYAGNAQYSFHVPPSNSIDHLHLHAIASPHSMSWKNYLKYNTNVWWSQSSDEIIKNILSSSGSENREGK